jgi:hypothetical protein
MCPDLDAPPRPDARIGAVLRLPARSVDKRRIRLLDVLPAYLAVRLADALTDAEREAYLRGVYAGRHQWTANFDGVQFTLGRAWYTHLEEDRVDEYFGGAAESDACVERFVPGLQAKMLALASSLVEAPVTQRLGWCGPGVHVFPAGNEVSFTGGEVHFDSEGLSEEQLAARTPALSLVLMLEPPDAGGGLRVWDAMFDGDSHPREPDASVASATITYEPGELLVIDSYRLHQILPFSGSTDRVSATMHLALEDGQWEAWF